MSINYHYHCSSLPPSLPPSPHLSPPYKYFGSRGSAPSCDLCGNTGSMCGGDCEFMTTTNLCRSTLSNDVRTASVHLRFSKPGGVQQPAWWFQRVVVTDSSDASYFATVGNAFGYGGIQQVRETPFLGRVLFSIWDQGCDKDVVRFVWAFPLFATCLSSRE